MTNKSKQFDSFLTKTIIGNAKLYYKRKIHLKNLERVEDNSNDKNTVFTEDYLSINSQIDDIELKIVLENAIERLSALEQAVIFLLFNQGQTQEFTAEKLNLYSTSVSRIRNRALKKLRKMIEKGEL